MVDPRVRVRIERGAAISSADLLNVQAARASIRARFDALTADYDAVLMPTVVIVPPPIDDVEASDDLYAELNPLILRNTTLGNFLDCCALSIPVGEEGGPPAGLMVMDRAGADDRLIRVGLGIESVLAP